ncbi:MAG: hypothetical protein Q9220_005787 [cf. Caloplaca sp. 1 TL-2023]
MEHDGASDYGSDFTPDEEQILQSLLQQTPISTAHYPDLSLKDHENDESPPGARVPRRYELRQHLSRKDPTTARKQKAYLPVEMEGNSSGPANIESSESRTERDRHERSVSIEAPVEIPPLTAPIEEPDLRSPLERFRTKPKKPLSVTDLVSPSWCELQYWYTLTKHGKKKRTPAMRQGSAVHKTLEEEVHQTVAIDIQTKEDAWGLRIWNVIQGLRTLRETGMTRELEVWGVFDGLVVNGIIDELSYTCPDPELEASELDSTSSPVQPPPTLPADQKSITDFLSPKGTQDLSQANFGAAAPSTPANNNTAPPPPPQQKIYITDTKTRSTPSLPRAASFRPTLLQLNLYRRLLSQMISSTTSTAPDPAIIFARHGLKPDEPFTDTFIAQLGEIYYDAPTESSPAFNPLADGEQEQEQEQEEDQDTTLSTLLAHNSLSRLWTLMLSHLKLTFPHSDSSISHVLCASYRSSSTGSIMGNKTFLSDAKVLDHFLDEGLRWWRGQREAQGVVLEEAWKCGGCEFSEGCKWRVGRVEEARERVRLGREREMRGGGSRV